MKSKLGMSPMTEGAALTFSDAVPLRDVLVSGLTGWAWKSVFWPESKSKNWVFVKMARSSSMVNVSSTAVVSCGLMVLRSRRY